MSYNIKQQEQFRPDDAGIPTGGTQAQQASPNSWALARVIESHTAADSGGSTQPS